MITLSFLLNSLGLSFSFIGGYFGATGFFKDKIKALYWRASLSFFNPEYFYSMLEQKYNGMMGLTLIAIGSAIQFISLFINTEKEIIDISRGLFVILFISFTFMTTAVCSRIVKCKVNLENDKVMIKYDLENYKYIVSQNSKEGAEQIDPQEYLDDISKRLKILDKTSPDEVIDKALRFCRKYNLEVR